MRSTPTNFGKRISIYETAFHLTENLEPLLKKCVDRDRSAQARVYDMFSPKMLNICMWYARNKKEAEEILQDGFLRVFTYVHTFSGKGSFEGWMRKIMINSALLRYRNKATFMLRISDLVEERHHPAEHADFINTYDQKKLLSLVQQLPPSCRFVFNLHVFEGMKHKEISKLLKISEGTSKSNLADARKILKTALMKMSLIKSI